jgi:hypothetical protein
MSERTLLTELTGAVVAWFAARAAQFHLRAEAIEARYILNWGGFVNASFTISDGETTYHLKLADDELSQASLERWSDLNEVLSQEYHAPRMLDWVEIPETGFVGPLFEYIPGKALDLAAQPGVRQEVLDLLARLHNDEDLASLLQDDEEENPTCADYFLSVYIDRFDEDLRIVAGEMPPFVSLSLLDWMMGETRELEGLARSLPEFQNPANAPTHGDLWTSNILVTAVDQWYIIDWDDLNIGDPALEYAIFLGPLWRNGNLSISEVEALLPAEQALRTRISLCLRAFLLDEVIDFLADWVECTFAPELVGQVRSAKEKAHREALQLYKQLYG